MPPPNVLEPGRLTPPAAAVARFRHDLSQLIDVDRDRLLVAVSGGADSLALLLLAHAALGDRCHAATVDHGLRAAATDEARHVAAICAARGIGHAILSGSLPGRSGRSANLSARARLLRYRLLGEHAAAHGPAWIATGHHADDQLETLVMRLNRGAGVAGLAGIRRKGEDIVRPLLGWRRAELAAIVRGCSLAAIDDPSNVDDRYDRARLRKALADADWLDVDRACASARALGDAEEALAWIAGREWITRARVAGGTIALDPFGLPLDLQRRLVVRALAMLEPDRTPTGPALTRLIDALLRGRPASIGEVLVRVSQPHPPATHWHFRRAPPRRAN